MRLRALESFTLKPGRLLIVTKCKQGRGQIGFGRKGERMVGARMPNAMLQYFAMNRAGPLKIKLFEQDLPKRTANIHSHRMFTSARGSEAIDSLVQQVDGSLDVAHAPQGNGEFVNHGKSSRITRAEEIGVRIQRI
jgi:hypothetical protein